MKSRNILTLAYVTAWSLIVYASSPLQYLEADTSGKGAGIRFEGSAACDYNCRGLPKTYFCASNGRTLDSMCRVRQARCNDPYLNVTVGKCKSSIRCQKERHHNLRLQSLPNLTQTVNVPSCKNDGSYTSTQCNMFFGYCWCVTPLGKMIKNSTFRIGTSSTCARAKARGKFRCSTEADKASFAISLRTLIENEGRHRSSSAASTNLADAVRRKHIDMDTNDNGSLNSRELRRLLKKYRRKLPRSCMKVFLKFCDYNENKQVSLAEWELCLGILPNMRNYRMPVQENRSAVEHVPPHIHDPLPSSGSHSNHSGRQNTSPSFAPNTCQNARQELLKGHKKNVKIPDCEGPDNRYWSRVQCHGSYCYCVVRETGLPVHATAVRASSGRPNCEKAVTSPYVPHPIPGCPTRLKQKFLISVHRVLIQAMAKNRVVKGEEGGTIKDRAAKWYFAHLDQNGDRLLSRKESKAFKKNLLKSKVSKKCLKKFTLHCDRNKDSKIALEEFIGCLEVHRNIQRAGRLPPYPDLFGSINQLKTTEDTDNTLR